MTNPVYKHELQESLFSMAQADVGITEEDLKVVPDEQSKDAVNSLLFQSQHHHCLVIAASLEKTLDSLLFQKEKKKPQVTWRADGYERTRFQMVDRDYIAIETDKKKDVHYVDVSMVVYPENISNARVPVTEEETSAGDEKKTKGTLLKTAACIPVVFFANGKSTTRHYQEEAPMTPFPGMTMRPLMNMISDIHNFIVAGTVPTEVSFQ